MPFNVSAVRRQFPILREQQQGYPLVYLDSAATTQKPQVVLDRILEFSLHENANVNRGVHFLAERATEAYEHARRAVQRFVGARKAHEIIFTRNTTEAINLVARTWGGANVQAGDVILLSLLEHHSNIVPWQQLAAETGASIEWVGIRQDGELSLDDLRSRLSNGRVKMLAITAVSNVLGTVTPLPEIIALAHESNAAVLVDAAQLAAHGSIDVHALGCDFLAFSGHKLYGPTGIGVLYGREEHLLSMPPFLGGGDMIQTVTTEEFTPAELPRKFEAGTPAITEAIGLEAAIEWFTSLPRADVETHERLLLAHALQQLTDVTGLKILGFHDASKIASCISFTLEGIHPHDLTQLLSDRGICLRAGHHCTQPLHQALGITASTRLSVGVYNTEAEIDRCVEEIGRAQKILRR